MSEGPRPGGARPPAAVSPRERERTVRRLTRHFARDHLELPELERRLDLAFAARTPGGTMTSIPPMRANTHTRVTCSAKAVSRKSSSTPPMHATAVICRGATGPTLRPTPPITARA